MRSRVPFETTVSFVVNGETLTGLSSCDVSMSGIFLITPNPLPLGTVGEVTLVLTSGEEEVRVQSQAEVVRVTADGDMPGMGLAFVDLDPDSSIALYNIVKYHTQDDA